MTDSLIFSPDGETITGVRDKNITHIMIPDSVTTIGNHAFDGCYALQSIDIPNSVTKI